MPVHINAQSNENSSGSSESKGLLVEELVPNLESQVSSKTRLFDSLLLGDGFIIGNFVS